jgi:hypothetical protein
LAESEKHCIRLQKLSELKQSTLQTALDSGEKMVKDMELLEEKAAAAQTQLKAALSEKAKLEATLEVELQSSCSLRTTIQSLQSENLALKSDLLSAQAARDQALSDKEKMSEERDLALSEKGVALTARDQATSRLKQAIEEKKLAISHEICALEERREAVERIEELHLQVVELTKELSQVPELRDSSWAVGYNWGFEHYRDVAKSASPGDESFKDLDISTIQIPDAALETMGRLGVEQFPHVTNWSQKVSQPIPLTHSDSGSSSATPATAPSPRQVSSPGNTPDNS